MTKLLSLKRDASFDEAVKQIARRWGRQADTLVLTWRDGSAACAVRTEEQWRNILRLTPKGPIELIVESQAAPPSSRPTKKTTLSGLAASSKSRAKARGL